MSHAYRSPVIISIICDLFFTGKMPFVLWHQDLLPSHEGLDGNITYEVPMSMVALVATVVCFFLLIVLIFSNLVRTPFSIMQLWESGSQATTSQVISQQIQIWIPTTHTLVLSTRWRTRAQASITERWRRYIVLHRTFRLLYLPTHVADWC